MGHCPESLTVSTHGLETESNLEHQQEKSNSEGLLPQAPDMISQTSIMRGCHQAKCPGGVLSAGSGPRLVGKSSEHHDMIQLVTALYEGKSSSWMPVDIRRDRAEVETATGFDRAAGYGELLLADFIDMLDGAGAHAGQNFYDLGSGLGQLVFTAGLLGLDATGVEIVKQRHEQAVAAVQQAEEQGIGKNHGSIKFLHGSFYDVDFSDADIVFINSVLFSDEMMRIISQKARSMKHGSRIISYLGLQDVGRDQRHVINGAWFRQMKSISMRTTFSSGSPWKSYMAVRRDDGIDATDQQVFSATPQLGEYAATIAV